MKKKNKGFTLIELLAVIVILGLLMAIAIPSVTKYITQSRKKTLTNTIGNYMGALVNEVNDMTYTFTGTNTIYAVPIECIAVERGGTNPFGKWHQANNSYWAYVLIQYDDTTSSYRYGFTFKDSAGYGLYPTTQAKLNEKGSQIVTGLDLSKPTNGLVTEITPLANWTGFDVDGTTQLKVLTAGSEDQVGNGVNTCTLVQKGDNYAQIEEEKEEAKKDEETNGENKPEEVAILHFGKRYSIFEIPNYSKSYIFFEDGSVGYYENGFNAGIEPANTVTYEEGKILLDGEIAATISSDKMKITIDNVEYVLEQNDSSKTSGALTTLIKNNTPLINEIPTFTTTSSNAGDKNGLYKTTETNSGKEVYYFRGDITNNYVKFAGFLWQIIRINDDGSIRMILQYGKNSALNSTVTKVDDMYYSNSDLAKGIIDLWYEDNIINQGYDSFVSKEVFCEQQKTNLNTNANNTSGIMYKNYAPNFKCSNDSNGKGILNSKVGLITYDDLIHAGGYYSIGGSNYYLKDYNLVSMSPAGYNGGNYYNWTTFDEGAISNNFFVSVFTLNPVINLNANVLASGTGTISDPYIIKTN